MTCFVDVTVAVPNPDDVDTAAVAKRIALRHCDRDRSQRRPRYSGRGSGGDGILIANAAVLVSLDDGK